MAGLMLCACGSVSEATAMTGWEQHSSFNANAKTLFNDVKKSAKDLGMSSISSNGLHTVCQVLYDDDGSMQSALPTPDAQATSLLNRAYKDFANGAGNCYRASLTPPDRAKALSEFTNGAAAFSEARARVATAAQS
jgi:hypothetical protein